MILLKPKIFLLFLLPLSIFLTFNKHSKDKKNSYYGVIWADAAGYYVYNPIWFIYGNEASSFPKDIEKNVGNGFHLSDEGTVVTKYPCGVAILQAPFFLISHALAKPLGFEADGFSKIYSYGLYFAGIIYCCLGLFFLSKFLSRQFSPSISIIAPLLFLAGTNLFYYSIDAPGMSHIYSFFLFSIIIYLTPTITSKVNFKTYLLFYVCVVLAILTRPTNILILFFPLLYAVNSKKDFINRLKLFFENKFTIIIALLLSSIVLLPQLKYWHHNTGNFINYSYGDEGFSNLKSPKLLEVWFSTNNGLFTYSPLIFLSIIGIVLLIKNKNWSGYFYGALFLLISYVFASWWCWWFGCSFGGRSFIEYYTVLIIPFCYLLQQTKNNKLAYYAIILAICFCCYLNLDMEYYYDGCFYGGTWDFSTYLKLLNS
jgi:hypothetical protein